jgi:hypothetical protein
MIFARSEAIRILRDAHHDHATMQVEWTSVPALYQPSILSVVIWSLGGVSPVLTLFFLFLVVFNLVLSETVA